MMGWQPKMASLSFLLIGFFALSVSAETSQSSCNPTANPTVNILTGSANEYDVLSVSDLKNTVSGSCTWNISQSLSGSYLDLTSVIIDSKDTLTVIGIKTDKNDTKTTTLFQSKSSPQRGLVSLVGYNNVIVQLNLTALAANSSERVFYSVYYWSSPISLQRSEGQMTLPLNSDKTPISGAKLEIQPGAQFDDQVIMLNFTQLPQNISNKITVDGVNLSATSPTVFLQSNTTIVINLIDMPVVEQISFRYWLVNAKCSEKAVLKTGEKKAIRFPNAADRKERQLSAVRCGMYYSTDAGNKFVVHVPSQFGLADSPDSVNFYDGHGKIELGLNNPAVMYFSNVDTLIETNTAIVLYESPYAISPNASFQAPEIKAIPTTQERMVFIEKDTPVEIKFLPNEETAHLIMTMDPTKNIEIVFPPAASLKPGDVEIKVYNSETTTHAVPIATLGQYSRLPVSIASNTPMLRATFKGKQPSTPFTVTYRLVDSNSTCGRLSTQKTNFEVKGDVGGVCTWYIPESSDSSSVVLDPTVIKLPAGKVLTMTNFADPGKPYTLTGPFSGNFFPDLVLTSAKSAYEISVNTSQTTANDMHVLIATKKDYVARNSSFMVDDKVSSISSINYPGAYPVGSPQLTESWNFFGNESQWALVSFEDIHLAQSHRLALTAQKAPQILFSGDVNMATVPDYLVFRPFFITQEVDSPLNLTAESKRGFKASISYPGFADNLSIIKETTFFFNSSNATAANPMAIWHLVSGEDGKPNGDTILHVNVTLAQGISKTKAKLSFYDSLSMRPANVHHANGSFMSGAEETTGHFLGSIRSLWIVYDYSASAVGKDNLTVTFVVTPENCNNKNYTLKKCATMDRCITDMMVCNGINECGDWSDEMYCKGNSPPAPPAPPTPASGGGVNTFVCIFLLMPMSAVLGIVGYIYLPQFMMRIRRGRYSEFRDLSEVS